MGISFKVAPKLELVEVGNIDIGIIEVVKRGCLTPAEEEKVLSLFRLQDEAFLERDEAKAAAKKAAKKAAEEAGEKFDEDKFSVPPELLERFVKQLSDIECSLAAELLRRVHPDWDAPIIAERKQFDAKTMKEQLPKPLVSLLAGFMRNERAQWVQSSPDLDSEVGKPSTGMTTSEALPSTSASASTDSNTTSPATPDGEAGKASASKAGSKSRPASEKPSD